MKTGYLTDILEFVSRSKAKDEWNQPSTTYELLYRKWARLVNVGGEEVTVGGEIIYQENIVFILRKDSNKINIEDRFNYEGTEYQIVTTTEIPKGFYKGDYFNFNESVEITAFKVVR